MEQRPIQILIADDEAPIRLTMDALLRRRGYAVIAAESAEEAIDLIHQHSFDLLLLDLKMPGQSGLDVAARRFAWVTLKPVTGRTHQLRVHMAQLGNPIMGDPRYFNIENFQGAPGLGEGLHLHARRIRLPLRSGKVLDVSAPLPPHMVQSFDALGFDADRYDVKDQDPEAE